MNVIWIVSDTLRRDHLGAYGNTTIHTPTLDALAATSVRFDRHYAAAFPTMCSRADQHSGRWTMSFMGWEPLPNEVETVAEIVGRGGVATAAAVDTPFYMREGMNYDRGLDVFLFNPGQDQPGTQKPIRAHESVEDRSAWRYEEDRNAPRTVTNALRWLERHHTEHFFLYVDLWDPHEPWDAPAYYTERYLPGYDGGQVDPVYGHIRDAPWLTENDVRTARATYMGEISMVDTWLGLLLRGVDNMGLRENTAIIFVSDHGFYFGEHDGLFGKLVFDTIEGGVLPPHGSPGVTWDHSPLYEELVHVPLLIRVPGTAPGAYPGLTSMVDLAPTALELLGQEPGGSMDGLSLVPSVNDGSTPGRDFVVSSMPFANPGDPVRSFDTLMRHLRAPQVTTVTTDQWSLLYSAEPGRSELFDLGADPAQEHNVVAKEKAIAGELHSQLLRFMRETNAAQRFIDTRAELRL